MSFLGWGSETLLTGVIYLKISSFSSRFTSSYISESVYGTKVVHVLHLRCVHRHDLVAAHRKPSLNRRRARQRQHSKWFWHMPPPVFAFFAWVFVAPLVRRRGLHLEVDLVRVGFPDCIIGPFSYLP